MTVFVQFLKFSFIIVCFRCILREGGFMVSERDCWNFSLSIFDITQKNEAAVETTSVFHPRVKISTNLQSSVSSVLL